MKTMYILQGATENMERFKKEHGPECVALFSHGAIHFCI